MDIDRRTLLGTAAAAGLAALAPRALAAPNRALDRALDGVAEDYIRLYPDQATMYGYDKGPRAGLKARLSDRSWAGVQADRAFCRDKLKALAAIPDAGLDAQDRLDKAVIAYALELGQEAAPFDFGDNTLYSAMTESQTPYVVSQNTGAYAAIPEFLDSQHAIQTPADAEAYLERVRAFARQLADETGRIARDTGQGVIAPAFILDNAIGQQAGLLVPAGQSRLVQSIARRTKGFAGAARYEADAARLVEREVYPALAGQMGVLKAARDKAGADAGVWRLKDGEAYYRWCLKVGTTTDMSPDEVHAVGLEQGRQIDARMDAILKANGLTRGTVGERMAALTRDPKYLFPDTDAGRAQILDYLNGVIAAVRPKLGRAFNLKLKAPVLVKRVPVDIQDGAAQGYMVPGTGDGSRPSIYYINLKSTANWPRFALADLTYHETVPGHAWQGAYLTESGKVRMARMIINGFNAYVEGYALYAEQLADEIGMYEGDWAGQLGYLTGMRFSAVRLVVDTGIHAKRWTRDQAIDFAMAATGRARDGITSEIDRYISWPGQACGYKIGQIEIDRLRSRTQAALGARYDLKAFNDMVVKVGAAPMAVLGAQVDDFIAAGGRTGL
jgi:uncharacterized protein (DUF885 family)